MLALGIILLLTTLLLCYAGYMFLVVDKKESQQMLENPELYDELDDKDYHFDLPAEIDEYEDVRASKPTDPPAPSVTVQRLVPPNRPPRACRIRTPSGAGDRLR